MNLGLFDEWPTFFYTCNYPCRGCFKCYLVFTFNSHRPTCLYQFQSPQAPQFTGYAYKNGTSSADISCHESFMCFPRNRPFEESGPFVYVQRQEDMPACHKQPVLYIVDAAFDFQSSEVRHERSTPSHAQFRGERT